jgi:hypothetical protein
VINVASKDFLLQHLVSHELLVSRKKKICQMLFIAREFRPLTADALNEMILEVEAHSFSERQANECFQSYIKEDDEDFPGDSRRRALLQFWTGWTVIPFGGLTKRLKVLFLPDDDDAKSLPTSHCLQL